MATPNYTLYSGSAATTGAGRQTNGGVGGTSYPSGYSGARGGRWSGNYILTWWNGSVAGQGEPGMPGTQTVANGDWGGVTYGGYGYGGGGGGEDEGTTSGIGGNGAPGFITLNFDCTTASPGAGGTASGGSGGISGAPSSLAPPVLGTLVSNPTSVTVYNSNPVTYTITASTTSGTAPFSYAWSQTESAAVTGASRTFSSSGNTATLVVTMTQSGGPYGATYTINVSCTVSDVNGMSRVLTVSVPTKRN